MCQARVGIRLPLTGPLPGGRRAVKPGRGDADTAEVTDLLRCPACAARLPGGSVWCSLCHADLRPPAPPPPPPPPPPAAAGPAVAGVGTGPVGRSASDRGLDRELDRDLETLAEQLAVQLAQSERGAGLPGLVTHRRTAGGRLALAAAVAVALVGAMLVGMAAVGQML